MKSFFKNKYRIRPDSNDSTHPVLCLECKRWWFPFWVYFGLTHTQEAAKRAIRRHRGDETVYIE